MNNNKKNKYGMPSLRSQGNDLNQKYVKNSSDESGLLFFLEGVCNL